MKYTLKDLQMDPNKLAPHYRHFGVADRLLLTGHSHQAWPDVAFDGIKQAWEDAAAHVDDKWGRAFEKAREVRNGFASLLDDEDGYIALGSSTHELVVRFLSSLPLRSRRKLITTDGEFHSIRRQLSRLSEEGIEVIRVPSYPVSWVASQIIRQLDETVAAVLISSVFFDSGLINPGLKLIAGRCRELGIELLVDAYHSLNVAPFSIRELDLTQAFVTGGGYKYCQLGEGNCFLRFPQDYKGRPLITGWFSEFSLLSEYNTGRLEYGQREDLFAGSTYDPVSHYRAAAVFDFFRKQNLTPAFLRTVSLHQVGLLASEFDRLNLPEEILKIDRSVLPEERAGFLVLHSSRAGEIHRALHNAGVLTDYRGNALRFGPAPYHSDRQLIDAMGILGDVVKKMR